MSVSLSESLRHGPTEKDPDSHGGQFSRRRKSSKWTFWESLYESMRSCKHLNDVTLPGHRDQQLKQNSCETSLILSIWVVLLTIHEECVNICGQWQLYGFKSYVCVFVSKGSIKMISNFRCVSYPHILKSLFIIYCCLYGIVEHKGTQERVTWSQTVGQCNFFGCFSTSRPMPKRVIMCDLTLKLLFVRW